MSSAAAWSIRDTVFGDAALAEWPPEEAAAIAQEPWKSFVDARAALAEGRASDAIAAWQRMGELPGLESRHYAQAWHFLRSQGVRPPPERAKELLAVVLELPMNGGLDLLAAYPERTARYYNFSGAGVIWEHPDSSLDPFINALLRASQCILDAIGPWEEARPPAPPAGQIRLNVVSPAGLHFGQGPFQVMAKDPLAKAVIDAGTALMQRMVPASREASPPR